MSGQCCEIDGPAVDARYRRVLWAVLGLNLLMFMAEIGAALVAHSASLLADAIDFLGDAANYGLSLFVVGMALEFRARAALAKGAAMVAFGLWVLASATWHLVHGTLPDAATMGATGAAALLVNVICFVLLWAYRKGDSNMRSVWLCSRNDVIGNLAVLAAAVGVFGARTGWPDAAVAAIMGSIALQGAWLVIGQALGEIRLARAAASDMA
jgi:Co/Zn/Cd efflux system component